MKVRIKRWLVQSQFASHWTAILQSKIYGALSWRHRVMQFGRSHISLSAKITGWASCQFGRNVVVGARSWININQRGDVLPSLIIGDNAFIGQDNFFTVGKSMIIGPYCLTASHCSFIGSSHLIDNPMQPYSTTGTSDQSKIKVGANCFFGYGAMVLGNVVVGDGCIIGAGAVVRNDIPPFSVAVGNPAKVVRYFDFSKMEWRAGERPRTDEAAIPSEEVYLNTLRAGHPFIIQPISASSALLSDI